MVRVFASGPGDLGSVPGQVIPKTLKMVLDATLLNTQFHNWSLTTGGSLVFSGEDFYIQDTEEKDKNF